MRNNRNSTPGSAKKKKRLEKKSDIVHIALFLLLLLYTFYSIVGQGEINIDTFWTDLGSRLASITQTAVFDLVGSISFLLFGITGLYEFVYSRGLIKLLPSYYIKMKQNLENKTAERMMKTYYERDISFIRQYEQERAEFVLRSLNLKEAQFQSIRYELIRARIMPENNKEDLRKKAKQMIYNKAYIIDQTEIPYCDKVYTEVNYFINLYTAVYVPDFCNQIGKVMASYIMMCYKEDNMDILSIDYVVIPYNSNLLLGLEVGRLLQKPVVAIQSESRIIKETPWDGNYCCRLGHTNHIIVVHDVLVSGNRIRESINKLTAGSFIVDAVFCLVQYNLCDHSPKEMLEKEGISKLHCLVKTDEETLKNVYNGKYNSWEEEE